MQLSSFLLAAMSFVSVLFMVLQAALYAVGEFSFLLWSVFIVIITVFTPAVVVAAYAKSTVGLFVASSLTVVALTIVFLWKVCFVVLPHLKAKAIAEQPESWRYYINSYTFRRNVVGTDQ